jgi:hypothetical protein
MRPDQSRGPIHNSPKHATTGSNSMRRGGCKPYRGNSISSACISAMRRRRQLGLIFRSVPWTHLQALKVCRWNLNTPCVYIYIITYQTICPNTRPYVKFRNKLFLFFGVALLSLSQYPSCKSMPFRLSTVAYSIHSQLPCVLPAIRSSPLTVEAIASLSWFSHTEWSVERNSI